MLEGMSHVTSAPAYSTFAGDKTHQQDKLQLDYPGPNQFDLRTNIPENPQPVQRVDSFDRSDYSHDTLPTLSTGTSFDFDHPTPVGSGDEVDFRTPEIEDLYWQENFHENDASELMHNSASYDSVPAGAVNSVPPSAGLASHKTSLPSPQSTSIYTPDASGGHSKKSSLDSTLLISSPSCPNKHKRSPDLDAEMSESASSSQYLRTPVQPFPQPASPIIQISRHTRGDSPARSTDFGESKISKKRSASNLSQGEYFPDMDDEQRFSHLMPPSHDTMEDWEEEAEQRTGVAPTQRDAQEIQSLEETERQQELDSTVTEVQHWLETTSLDPSSARRPRDQARPDRIRSKSTGARPAPGQYPILKSSPHPGPGLEVEECSDYYYSSDEESEYSLAPEDYPETHRAEIPPRRGSGVAPDEQAEQNEPLPRQFFRRQPWQDPFSVRLPDNSTRYQPDTSKAAMHMYDQRSKEFETASRAATWGTGRRRLSDGEQISIVDVKETRHLSLIKPGVVGRGMSLVHGVKAKAKEHLKRSNSRSKQNQMHGHELEKVQSPEPIGEPISTESQHQHHNNSYPKPKSPSISAALKEVTGNLAAVGAGSAGLNLETEPQHKNFVRWTIGRVRSISDVNRPPKSPTGAAPMMAQLGGPPAPIPSARYESTSSVSCGATPVGHAYETSTPTRSPIIMSLSPLPTNVTPNLEGFKVQITKLNPNLAPYLVERIAHDQVRRYRRLINNRVEHLTAATHGKCNSKHLCPNTGGTVDVLPARTGGPDAGSSSTFKVAPGADSDNDESTFDGNVTPAAFPDGIPLPPTLKLPARFECHLCFQVKTFQKPSDWTKHVHEDIQPFTCTFPNCTEPKSFKRKADWVRHENERHRHLEWWKCNIDDCTHICYRKDNFVQHLVREHKLKEPKSKGRGNSSAKVRAKGTAKTFSAEEQEFWGSVDSCRHDSAADARNEPCKFCHNICTSWKKLSVHVGKHMEQIAMPVLELAEKKIVTKDTIVSPIEPLQKSPPPYRHGHVNDLTSAAVSPFTQSAASNYQSCSAGHSPAFAHAQPGVVPSQGNYLRPIYGLNGMRQSDTTSTPHVTGVIDGHSEFAMQVGYGGAQYETYLGQHMMYTHNDHIVGNELIAVPRTTAPDTSYGNTGIHSTYGNHQYYSSPDQQVVQYQHSNMMHMNGLTDQSQIANGQALQMPVITESIGSHGYAYAHPSRWQ